MQKFLENLAGEIQISEFRRRQISRKSFKLLCIVNWPEDLRQRMIPEHKYFFYLP